MNGGEILLPRTPLFSLKTVGCHQKGALPRTVLCAPCQGWTPKKLFFFIQREKFSRRERDGGAFFKRHLSRKSNGYIVLRIKNIF